MPALKNSSNSIQFQERDLALLRGLFESRVMTAGHIASLYFDGKKEATKKRLQKLKTAGLIGERRRSAFEPAVLFLTRKAFDVLRERGVLTEYPRLDKVSLEKRSRVSEFTLRHELEVMDVKTAFHSVIKQTKVFSVAEFSTWPLLNEFEAFRSGFDGAPVPVKPDGFIRIHEKENDGGLSEHTFFLELDRSTEILDTLVARAGCYLNYHQSGGFAVRNGAERSAFKEFPFRVLMIFRTAERRNNTAARLLLHKPPVLALTYLSTFEEVICDPLGKIWIRPVDYREATKGTPFATVQPNGFGYKRQTAREIFVEGKIKKHGILVDE
jgi:hypothetical protein